MTIYEVLKGDHKLLKQWLKELETETAAAEVLGEEAEATPTFRIFARYLEAHSKAEEAVFYQRLKGTGMPGESAQQGKIEHDLTAQLMQKLQTLPLGILEWNAHFTVLKGLLEHHIQEEESVIFNQARAILSTEEEESLGRRMEELRDHFSNEQKRLRRASLRKERGRPAAHAHH
jgi:hemerythrin-like domain-containing protein